MKHELNDREWWQIHIALLVSDTVENVERIELLARVSENYQQTTRNRFVKHNLNHREWWQIHVALIPVNFPEHPSINLQELRAKVKENHREAIDTFIKREHPEI
jgi:hypothetical protein